MITIQQREKAKVRALVDQGTEISLISERMVQRLRIPRKHSSISLMGIRAKSSNNTFRSRFIYNHLSS